MPRSICPEIRSVANFAAKHARLLTGGPGSLVRDFDAARRRNPRYRAADLIGESGVAKFGEGDFYRQPTRDELYQIVLGLMPDLKKTTLDSMPDDALADLAAELSSLSSRVVMPMRPALPPGIARAIPMPV